MTLFRKIGANDGKLVTAEEIVIAMFTARGMNGKIEVNDGQRCHWLSKEEFEKQYEPATEI